MLIKEGLKVKVLRLDHDDVKDPDEYINKYGKEHFDHANYYSITAHGYAVMRGDEKNDRKKNGGNL